jgi:hypothetical protein
LRSDKAGRSIPAPGRGALSVAKEIPAKYPLPILDVAYRSRQLNFRRNQISQWLTHEHSQLREEIEFRKSQGEPADDEYFSSRVADIEKEASRQEKDAIAMYGMLADTDARISPLRRALAVWGLTGDDIGVLSIHGTSTRANVSCTLFLADCLLNHPTGKERDSDLERHFHVSGTYSWKRGSCHGSEESARTFEGRISCMADDGSTADRRHWYYPRQQKFRVSSPFPA